MLPLHRASRRLGFALVAGVLAASSAAILAATGARALDARVRKPEPAASVPAEMFAALKWRNVGPNRGGRSLAATGVPSRPAEYYFGAVGGGVWKTTDAGTTWTPVTDGQLRSSSVGAIAVAESNPDVVFAGMGEVALRGNIMQGDGVYKSTDAGKTWAHAGLPDSQVISRIRIHPSNPDLVYVAAFGHPSRPNPERGVYRSRDGGTTWQRVLFRDERSGAVDLVIDRRNPSVLYAALWEAFRVSYQMSSGGPGSGLFKSVDGGDTWVELTRKPGLPRGVVGKIGVAVSPVDARRLYAIVEAADGGVFRSDDAGDTWTRVSEDRRLRQRAFYYSRVYADPANVDALYVLNVSMFRSSDGGKTYKVVKVPHADNHDLWIDPANPSRMINSNDGGANVSINGGETWTGQDYPTAQLYHVATTKDVPYHVCGAQQDNTTLCVPSDPGTRFRDPRQSPGDWLYTVGGGESGYVAPHPVDPNIFFAGSQGALLTRYDRSNGQVRDVQVYPRFFSGEPASVLKERWQWTFPIVFSPHDPNVLYTSSQHVWRTSNGGQNWDRISGDLTNADPKTLGESGGPITKDMNGPEIFGTVFTIGPSKVEKGLIWTGSDDGLIHVTRDEGATWANVTPPDLPAVSRVSIIEPSPHDAATAYFCAKRYLEDDRAPYVFRSRDYGKTWTKVVTGIRSDDYVHVVREDPVRHGLLYAGTEHGVYVSFDAGDHWQSLSLNLPDTQVSDLVVEAHDLVAGTHGRSIWILDDIDVLRAAGATLPKAPTMFPPRPAVRSVNGAVVDYFLPRDAAEITVEILDGAGAVLRTVRGSEAEDAAIKEANARADEGLGLKRPDAPGRKKGVNRYRWDLRCDGAVVFEGMVLWGARADVGPVVVPATYQVRLTVDGAKAAHPLEVRIDPRLKDVTIEDLRQQFTLALQVRDRTCDANLAVIRIRDLKKQITERVPKAKSPVIGLGADATLRALSDVEAELYQVKNRSPQDPLNYPIKVNNRLAALRRSIETGDARPTDAARAVFQELSGELDALLARLAGVEANHVAAFNRLLTNGGLEPVVVPARK